MQAGRAQRLHRQEIAEQRAVGDIDRKGPAHDVAAPRRSVARAAPAARRDPRPAAIASPTMSAISAASRSPMLRPCAPIGGTTWAASPTSAMRLLRRIGWAARSRAETDGVPASTRTRPRMECDCFSAASDSSSSLERHQPLGFRRRRRPTPRCSDRRAAARTRKDPAACETRSRYSRCGREWLTLKVSAAWSRSRRRDRDAGGLAAQRLPAVGADHKPRRQ